jgi:hypothetical protein
MIVNYDIVINGNYVDTESFDIGELGFTAEHWAYLTDVEKKDIIREVVYADIDISIVEGE